MDKDNVRLELENLGIKSDKIDEFIINIKDKKEAKVTDQRNTIQEQIAETQIELDNVPSNEWRRRAKLASRICSLRFDEI